MAAGAVPVAGHSPLLPAAVAGIGLLGAALAADEVLARHGHLPISAAARTRTGWGVVAVIVLHFARLLGPLDPFCALDRLFARWRNPR